MSVTQKAAVVLPPVDDDRVLARAGGPILWSQSVPARGSRTTSLVAQVVEPARVGGQPPRGYVRPSVG